MQRTITPILLMVAPNQLPDRLRQRQAVIYGEHEPLSAGRARRRARLGLGSDEFGDMSESA